MKPTLPFLITEVFSKGNDYQLLDEHTSSIDNKDIMNNCIGLQDQGFFKIVNLANDLVIELDGSKLLCKPQNVAKEEIQTFKATALPDGKFAISSKHQATTTFLEVWDYLPHRKLLIQKKQSPAERRNNQSWVSGHVPGFQSTYFILSAPDNNKCIKSMGEGEQIQIVEKSASVVADPSAHWKLLPVIPDVHVIPVSDGSQVSDVESPEMSPVPIVPLVPQTSQALNAPEVSAVPVLQKKKQHRCNLQ